MDLTEKLVVLAIGLLVIILWATAHFNKTDALKQLKEKYEQTLSGNSKANAYEAGLTYYKYLRGGELTATDEQDLLQAIAHLPDEGTDIHTNGV